MKILLVSALYPPVGNGGAEVIARTMAQGFVLRGDTVSVVTSKPYASWGSLALERRVQDGTTVYSWFPLNLYHYTQGERYPWAVRVLWHFFDIVSIHSLVHLRTILRSERPDIVITHNLMGLGFLLPVLVRRMGIPHVHVLHDVQLYDPSGIVYPERGSGARSLSYYTGYQALMRWIFRSVDLVISPSRLLISFYQRHGFFVNVPFRVTHNPIALPELQKTSRPSSILNLLYVGHLSESKGAHGLIELCISMRALPIHLDVIGEGELPEGVERRVRESGNSTLHGRIAHDKLQEYFQEADILIVPSLAYDAFPTVAAEALRSGVPVIASDSTGALEIIREGHNGWIFPSGDWEYLRSLLTRLTTARDEVERAASNAAASVSHLTSEEYLNVLMEAIRTQIHQHDRAH